MEDKIFEYCCIFKKMVDRMPTREYMENFLKIIADKNYVELARRLYPDNKASRFIFTLETGIKLPATSGGTIKVVQEYCKESFLKYKKELQEEHDRVEKEKEFKKVQAEMELDAELDGFMKGEPTMRRKAVLRYLTQNRYVCGGQPFTIRDYIRYLVGKDNCFPRKGKDGNWKDVYVLCSWTVHEVKSTDGYRYGEDCEIVDEHHIRCRAGGLHVTKTGYDYAMHLINKKAM